MDQSGGLKGLARRFVGDALGREPAQLVIDEGKQPLGGVRVAVVNGI